MPDYAAWGPDGSLYVTDYQQAVIWRIPPGGAGPIWLAARRLDGGTFGTACIRSARSAHSSCSTRHQTAAPRARRPATGKLLRWRSSPAAGRDRCNRSGRADPRMRRTAAPCRPATSTSPGGGSNQVVELDANGHELGALRPAVHGHRHFLGALRLTVGAGLPGHRAAGRQQAYFDQNTANQALLNVATGEPGGAIRAPPRRGEAVGLRGPARRTGPRCSPV